MIVIPMAGFSRRFTEAGYLRPKYMLDLHGKSLFAHAVGSFERYFDAQPFLFILRDVQGSASFVQRECTRLGVKDPRIVVLDQPTRGQAETVALGLHHARITGEIPLTIFNKNFDVAKVDGYLEVFRGTGANWSYVRPAALGSDRVAETTEKVPISDLCCTGLYHLRTAATFLSVYSDFEKGGLASFNLKELFVAPMYNILIRRGADIRYHLIRTEDVIFCGVPSEYEYLQSRAEDNGGG